MILEDPPNFPVDLVDLDLAPSTVSTVSATLVIVSYEIVRQPSLQLRIYVLDLTKHFSMGATSWYVPKKCLPRRAERLCRMSSCCPIEGIIF